MLDDDYNKINSFDRWFEAQNFSTDATLEQTFREITWRAWDAALDWHENQE